MSQTVKTIRGAGEDVLLLDAGGLFPQVPIDDGELKRIARAGMAAAVEMGYEAVNVTPGDLSQGEVFLREEAEKAGLCLLAANMIDKRTARPFGREYLMTSRGGFSIGVVGIVAASGDGTLERVDSPSTLAIRSPAEVLGTVVPKMRKEGADLVVLLCHGGSLETESLVKEVGGIDVAIHSGTNRAPENLPGLPGRDRVPAETAHAGGCSDPPAQESKSLVNGQASGLYQGNLKRLAMGYLRVVRDKTGGVRVDQARVVDLPSSVGEEPRVAALIDMDVEALLNRALAERDRRMEEMARELWKMSPLDMIRRSGANPDVKGE